MTDRNCIHGARATEPCEECGLKFVTDRSQFEEEPLTKRTTLPEPKDYRQVDKSVPANEVRK